jgi:hypothetical protein
LLPRHAELGTCRGWAALQRSLERTDDAQAPSPRAWTSAARCDTLARMSTEKGRIGKLPPRYSFILNPYPDERFSKCPRCRELTHPRKFALFIHVTSWGPLTLGKTCVYCSRCEMIVAHQHELEAQLTQTFDKVAPAVIGNEYLVLGTVDQQSWKAGLAGAGPALDELLQHMADFEHVLKVEVDPGGWRLPEPSKAKRRVAPSKATPPRSPQPRGARRRDRG